MRKNKSEIYLANMSISLYRDGDEAMTEVKNLHRGADVEIENAYIANYRSAFSSKAKFWVSESRNSEEAELAHPGDIRGVHNSAVLGDVRLPAYDICSLFAFRTQPLFWTCTGAPPRGAYIQRRFNEYGGFW